MSRGINNPTTSHIIICVPDAAMSPRRPYLHRRVIGLFGSAETAGDQVFSPMEGVTRRL